MKRAGLPALLALPVVVGSVLFLVSQGPAPAQAPESWRQLALPEFVAQITPLTTGATPLTDALWAEIRSQSAERLLGVLAGGAPADYGDLVSLYLWARPVLSPEQIKTVLAGLVPTGGQVAAWPLARLQEVHARMQQGQFPPDALHALTVAWLEPRDVRTIEDVEELAWLSERLQEGGGPEQATQALTVEWTGWVEAREEGTYTFCLPPFDLNLQHQNLRRTQSVSLWLDGERLLTATPDAWQWESTPPLL